jgi:hypothetical protein
MGGKVGPPPAHKLLPLLLQVPAVILNAVKDPEETPGKRSSDLSTDTLPGFLFGISAGLYSSRKIPQTKEL